MDRDKESGGEEKWQSHFRKRGLFKTAELCQRLLGEPVLDLGAVHNELHGGFVAVVAEGRRHRGIVCLAVGRNSPLIKGTKG